MQVRRVKPVIVILALVGVLIGLLALFHHVKVEETKLTKVKETKISHPKKVTKKTTYAWNKPSQASYPEITNPDNLSVKVSIKDQRVYIKEKNKTIYTIVCSTGDSSQGNATPKGKFEIEPERFKENYWPEYNDWAFNLVSFKGHGTYLFHSVLMLDKDTVEEEEAVKLGQEASHGCIRLPLPDSKWFYDNIPTGTPVEIY